MKKRINMLFLAAALIFAASANGQKSSTENTDWQKFSITFEEQGMVMPSMNVASEVTLTVASELSDALCKTFGLKKKVAVDDLTEKGKVFTNVEVYDEDEIWFYTEEANKILAGDMLCKYLKAVYTKKSGEEYDYLTTHYSPHYTDYDAFMKKYPTSVHRKEMEFKRDCLKAYQAWMQATSEYDLANAFRLSQTIAQAMDSLYLALDDQIELLTTEMLDHYQNCEGFGEVASSVVSNAEVFKRYTAREQNQTTFTVDEENDFYSTLQMTVSYNMQTPSPLLRTMIRKKADECEAKASAAFYDTLNMKRQTMSWIELDSFRKNSNRNVSEIEEIMDSIWSAKTPLLVNEGPCSIKDSAILYIVNTDKSKPVTISFVDRKDRHFELQHTLKAGEIYSTRLPVGHYETTISTGTTVLEYANTDIYNCIYSHSRYLFPATDIALEPSAREKKYANQSVIQKAESELCKLKSIEYVTSNNILAGITVNNGFIELGDTECESDSSLTEVMGDERVQMIENFKEHINSLGKDNASYLYYSGVANCNYSVKIYFVDEPVEEVAVEPVEEVAVETVEEVAPEPVEEVESIVDPFEPFVIGSVYQCRFIVITNKELRDIFGCK